MYVGILLGAHYILHISRIRVKTVYSASLSREVNLHSDELLESTASQQQTRHQL